MKIIITTLSLLLCTHSVLAADFRAANFGDSCEGIQNREISLGSTPDGPGKEKYRGVFLDREVEILYRCNEKNQLIGGSYIYTYSNLAEAIAFFNIAKPQLLEEFGEPKLDSSSEAYKKMTKILSSRGVESDKDEYNLFWEHDRVSITCFVIKPSKYSVNATVAITYGPIGKKP